MTDQIRDLEHRFNVAGRNYVLPVCGCGENLFDRRQQRGDKATGESP